MSTLSCGHEPIDELIDGLRIGDNVVLQVAHGVDPSFVIEGFVRAAAGTRPLAYVQATDAGADAARAAGDAGRLVLLDWSGGRGTAAAGRVESLPADEPAAARAQLEALGDELGSETFYVFDSLSALAQRWGANAALELFLWACPRLYRHGPVALWIVWEQHHDARFLARLRAITQVVLALRAADPLLELAVVKADGRAEGAVGRRMTFRLDAGAMTDVAHLPSPRERIGELIRAERLARGISQAGLARDVGVTPSALSQVERGVRGLSGERLTRVWERLGVPFGPDAARPAGYRVYRRGGQRVHHLAAGVAGRLLIDEGRATVWSLELAAGAAGTQPLFLTKVAEIVVVEQGAVNLEIAGGRLTLQEGDALSLNTAAVTGWSNPGGQPARLLWALLGH